MTTTPPSRPIVEPPTPLHGARFDSYEPQTVRKSTRISKRRIDRTPSPTGIENTAGFLTHRRSARISSGNHTYSPPSSNPASPQTMSRKRSKASTLQADAPAGEVEDSSMIGMLPTPVKTPRKKDTKALPPAARVLFPSRPDTVEEAMPKSRKRGRRNIGYSLQSFENDQSNSPDIEIYTDSKEKLPEIDDAPDNPFYVKSGNKTPVNKKANRAPDHNKDVQEMLERDEGMVYVFRGKKVYRKFDPEDDGIAPHGVESASEGLNLSQFDSPRHFTRSSVKPRLLFPTATYQQQQGTASDEEAPTDIEEASTPEIETPVKTNFVPATPPDTNRAKRTAVAAGLDSSPAPEEPSAHSQFVVKKAQRPSPFMKWPRTKAGQGSGAKGKKRGGDDLERTEEGKKLKG